MRLFLSWSGERSQFIAESLRDWLPRVIQAVDPWMSAVDIERGARWSTDIASQLEQTRFGILCLTPENLDAPWIHFEAGALSKTLEKTFVCPYLFDVEPADLKGPLVQFNAAKATAEDTLKLVHSINDAQETPLPKANLGESYEVWWPKLKERFANLPRPKLDVRPERSEREILEELLDLAREQARTVSLRTGFPELFETDESSETSPFVPNVAFTPGSYVQHPKYGRGLVLRREGKGQGTILTVSFPGFGQKRLVEKYAHLTEG